MEDKIKQLLKLSTSSSTTSTATADGGGEEFLYETIEAPKFVDFTRPNHFCPDDRYWFCSRVGCDRKHEEEIDSEAIYKNFVLRVMAARSPNVRLRKALTRKPLSESKKCPFSAPPKPSKSRLPRLALTSSITKKLINNAKSITKPLSTKPSTTPKARVKHVAAKYMTSPRKNKPASPNRNAFRSVRNTKRTSITIPKNKVVAKALVFNSPRKALKGKKTQEEMATPITKLCEGIKKLEIASHKKGDAQKPSRECKSVRKLLPCDILRKKTNHHKAKTQQYANFSRSVKSKTKPNKEKKDESVLGDDSSDMEIDDKSRAGSLDLKKTSSGIVQQETTSVNTMTSEVVSCEDVVSVPENPVTYEETKVDEEGGETSSGTEQQETASVNTMSSEAASCEDGVLVPENPVTYEATEVDEESGETSSGTDQQETSSVNTMSSEVVSCEGGVSVPDDHVTYEVPKVDEKSGKKTDEIDNLKGTKNGKIKDNDDKENALSPDDIRNLKSGKHGAPLKHKIPKTVDKSSKENCTADNGTQGVKYKKLKPTNPKPFRLRTDERGILKDATLERKANSHENSITTSENSQCTSNGEKETKDTDKNLKMNKRAPIKSKYKINPKEVETKPDRVLSSEKSYSKITSSSLQKQLARTQRETVSHIKSGLGAIVETTTRKVKPTESGKRRNVVVDPTKKASTSRKLAAQVKKPATVPREPDFQSRHKPKSCTKNEECSVF